MWLFDSLKARVKKWTDTVIDTTAKVWNFMEEKSATLMEKVPWGHELKEKASEFTEKAVDRVWTETKEMIQEWQWFIESHLKKNDITPESKPVAATTDAAPTTISEPEKKVVEKEATEPKKSHPHKKK